MKKLLLTLAVLFCVFAASAQCFPGAINGASSVIAGSNFTLVDSGSYIYSGSTVTYTSGGSWSSSNSSIATIDPVTGVAQGIAMGSAYITYTMAAPCGTFYTVHLVNVVAGYSGRTQICLGESVSLTHTYGGGTWTSSTPSAVAVNSTTGVITGLAVGAAAISYSYTVSGTPYLAIDSVRVRSVTAVGPVMNYMPVMCSGRVASLSNWGPEVTWMSSDPGVVTVWPGSTSYTATTLSYAPGTAWIIYTSVYCPSIKDSTAVTVNPSPSAGTMTGSPGTACPGSVIPLTITGATGTGSWSSSNPSVATVNSSGVVYVNASITSGVSNINYTTVNSFGCNANIFASIYVSTTPASYSITGPATVHVGTTANYSVSGFYGAGTWTTASTGIATISSIGVLTGLSTGTAIVTLTTTSACGGTVSYYTVNVVPAVIGDVTSGFTAFINRNCSATQLGVVVPAHAPTYQVVTDYGDGTSDMNTVASATATVITPFTHTYATSGTYSVKHVLYNGATALDSVMYSYQHLLCRDLSAMLYIDADADCMYDAASENYNFASLLVEIDSNGIVIDTIPATSGFYYHTQALAGDVYGYRLLTAGTDLYFTCSSSGYAYDTISAGGTATLYLGLTCSSGPSFDLMETTTFIARPNNATGTITVRNNSCLPVSPIVTLNISPKYTFTYAYPAPTSISGNTVTWNLPLMAASTATGFISYGLTRAGSVPLPVGDTVHTTISVGPTLGDIDLLNNTVTRIDTVRASYDPNHIEVLPAGNVLNGTNLHYAVEFENDGNDTAHNIYVLDTLSDKLNISTLRILSASAVMTTSVLHVGGYNIVRFDFPNIMLADSSHHGHCTGTFSYSINALTGLADGTDILAHVGIYFDDNDVILTGKAFNKIVIPNVTIAADLGDSICGTTSMHFTATPHSVNTPHYQWYVNGLAAGTDSVGFTLATAAVGNIVKCVMTTTMDEVVVSTSNIITVHSGSLPPAGTITGASALCLGAADITLLATAPAGTWHVTNANATVTGGIVHGVAAGIDTVYYSVTNACGTATTIHPVTINAMPAAGSITGVPSVCLGSSVVFTGSVAGGTWSLSNSHASHVGGTITGVSAGADTVFYTVTNMCGSAAALHVVTITAAVIPAVSATIYPNDTVCGGDTVIFTSIPVNGGTAPVYMWKKFGTIIATGTTLHYVPALGDVITCDMISSAMCPTDDTVTSTSTTMMVVPVVTPSAVISTAIGDSISYEGQVVTINSTLSYCGAGTYQWYRNGLLIPGETNATLLIPVSSDDTFYCVNNCNTPCATTNTDTSNTLVIYGDYLSVGVHSIHSSISNLALFPNPNNGSFMLTGTITALANGDVHFDVLDMTGKLLYSGTTTPQNGAINQRVNMADSNVAPGHYMLRVITGNSVEMLQFVIMK